MRSFGWIFGALLAVAQPPPISSQLPTQHEERQEQQRVVPPAQSQEEQLREHVVTDVIEGRLVQADEQTRTLSIATEEGPQRIHLSPGAKVTVDGQPVKSFSDLPQGQSVRAAYQGNGEPESIDLSTTSQENDQGVSQVPRRDQPTVEP